MRLTLLKLGILSTVLLTGCRTASQCDDQSFGNSLCGPNCEDIPKGAIPQPLGSYVCAWHGAQVAAADRDDRVLYSYQFNCGGDELSNDGKRYLRLQMQDTGGIVRPIIVQSVDDAELTVRRRNNVIDYLVQMGIDHPEDLVMVGESNAEGLLGQEVPRIANGITAQSNRNAQSGNGQSSFGGGGVF